VLLDASRLPAEALAVWRDTARRSEIDGLILPGAAAEEVPGGAVYAAVGAVDEPPPPSAVAGYLLGPGAALDAARVRRMARGEGRVLLTANALSRSELDACTSSFPAGRLVLVYRHAPADPAKGDGLRTMLALIKLERLAAAPVALAASPIHVDLATLAFVWGATAVVWELGGGDLPPVTPVEVEAATVRLRRAERFLQSADLVEMSAEDWDAIEPETASMVAVRQLRRGEVLAADMVCGALLYRGISLSLLPRLLGCRLRYDVAEGEALTFGLLDLPQPRPE
jgi:hypothetical protein